MQTQYRQAHELDDVVGAERSMRIEIHVKPLVQRADVADSPVVIIDFDQPVEA